MTQRENEEKMPRRRTSRAEQDFTNEQNYKNIFGEHYTVLVFDVYKKD
jgi:hypothetical protein